MKIVKYAAWLMLLFCIVSFILVEVMKLFFAPQLQIKTQTIIVGHFQSSENNVYCGFLYSENDLNKFIENIHTNSYIPSIDFRKNIWIYSEINILYIKRRLGDNLLFIKTNNIKNGQTIYMACVKRSDYSGIKYTSVN